MTTGNKQAQVPHCSLGSACEIASHWARIGHISANDRVGYALYLAGRADTVTILTVEEVERLIARSKDGEFDEDIVALQVRLPQEAVLRAEYDRYRRMDHLREMREGILHELSGIASEGI